MSDDLSIGIDYSVAYTGDRAASLLRVLKAAIQRNWAMADEWSSATPEYEMQLAELEVQCLPENTRPLVPGMESCRVAKFLADLSPLTHHPFEFTVFNTEDELAISLSCSEFILFEDKCDRECKRLENQMQEKWIARGEAPYTKTELPPDDPEHDAWQERVWWLEDNFGDSVWPQNRECLQDVVRALTELFPIREVSVDPRLIKHGLVLSES